MYKRTFSICFAAAILLTALFSAPAGASFLSPPFGSTAATTAAAAPTPTPTPAPAAPVTTTPAVTAGTTAPTTAATNTSGFTLAPGSVLPSGVQFAPDSPEAKAAAAAAGSAAMADGQVINYVTMTAKEVNVREEPSSKGKKLGVTGAKNAEYTLIDTEVINKEWYNISFNGQSAYVSTKYAKKGQRVYEAPEAAPPWQAPTGVSAAAYTIESAAAKIANAQSTINSDVIGWIRVPNTENIDYPVLIYTDNDYYLNRDIYKNKKTGGAIYMDYRNADANQRRHTIVYGHNMQKSKVDFYYLHNYMNDQNFFNTTRIIQMEAFGKSEWEVFSVHQSRADSKLIQTNFTKNAQFVSFCQSLAGMSKYQTNITFQPTDEILSLVTCDTNTRNDDYRVFIHARRVK